MKKETNSSAKSYTKEERCPIMRNGKVIGHAIVRVTYENDKPVNYRVIQTVLLTQKN